MSMATRFPKEVSSFSMLGASIMIPSAFPTLTLSTQITTRASLLWRRSWLKVSILTTEIIMDMVPDAACVPVFTWRSGICSWVSRNCFGRLTLSPAKTTRVKKSSRTSTRQRATARDFWSAQNHMHLTSRSGVRQEKKPLSTSLRLPRGITLLNSMWRHELGG